MFDVRCSMFDVRCSMFDVRCSMFDVRCSMFDVRCFPCASWRRWSRRSPTEADGALAFENRYCPNMKEEACLRNQRGADLTFLRVAIRVESRSWVCLRDNMKVRHEDRPNWCSLLPTGCVLGRCV